MWSSPQRPWSGKKESVIELLLNFSLLAHLCDLGIQKGDEGKRSEGLGDEDVRHLSELGKVIPQVISVHVFGAAANEHLAGNLLYLTLL